MKKIAMIRYWRRVKGIADGVINKVSESLASMRFWVQVSELHFWACVHYDEGFLEVILMKYSDNDVEGLCLWCDYIG